MPSKSFHCVFLTAGMLTISALAVQAQFTVSITVQGGSATTTCTDAFGSPDPAWSVDINGEGWVTYPALGFCYEDFPNVQFQATYDCFADVPASIPVCFRAFENDASIFNPCSPVTSCNEEICVDVPLPLQGAADLTIALPAGLTSGGEVQLTVETAGVPFGINDLVCQAIDFGVLPTGATVGPGDTSIFNNICATNLGDPDPGTFGNFWVNNMGVWFSFTTGGTVGSQIYLQAVSDPSGTGDGINLQVGVFGSDNNACDGNFTFLAQNHDPADWDEFVVLGCPEPNTTYFVLVDGVTDSADELDGFFGLSITDPDIPEAAEFKCDAETLGVVPPDGSVSTVSFRSNRCSGNQDAESASAFGVQRSVWFSFVAPPSGHILVAAVSDTIVDPIGLQIALYAADDDSCSGSFTEVASQHTAADLDEYMEVHCLDPGRPYFLQVDGAVSQLNAGNFIITVSDAGNETPLYNQTVVLCAGDSLFVGPVVHSVSGIYSDTLALPGGCDSIVVSDLTILPPLQLNLSILQQGIGPGNMAGSAQVSPAGGAGTYAVSWSDGSQGAVASGLVGGLPYCTTVSDGNGCSADTCWTMPFAVAIQPQVAVVEPTCSGYGDGSVSLLLSGGVPPYLFVINSTAGTFSNAGTIPSDGTWTEIAAGIPAGTYELQVTDAFFDTTFSVVVGEPDPLLLTDVVVEDASCFGSCDGSLTVTASGGTGMLNYAWSNGENAPFLSSLCAGAYTLSLSDANACSVDYNLAIASPAEFLVQASLIQPVSCIGGSDGILTVTTNGIPVASQWSNGQAGDTLTGLPQGNYAVTVTNADGCTGVGLSVVPEPDLPVTAAVVLVSPVVCHGEASGAVSGSAAGPAGPFGFVWENGSTAPTRSGLVAGAYTLTVSNSLGCTGTAGILVPEPAPITAVASTNTITCFDPPDAGVIHVDLVEGGWPPYRYGRNGLFFSSDPLLTGYTAGLQSFQIQDSLGCIRSFPAMIEGTVDILLDPGPPVRLDLGEQAQLAVSVNQPNLTIGWNPADFLSCTDCPDPIVFPTGDRVYTITATDDFGCSANTTLSVSVLKRRRLFIPNVFSPNGDGLNDTFEPYPGKDVAAILGFDIFDRQGNQVFRLANELDNTAGTAWWDGRFRGKDLPAGVYTWTGRVRFIDGAVEIIRGEVTLLR